MKEMNAQSLDWRKSYCWTQRRVTGNSIRTIIIGTEFRRTENKKEEQTNQSRVA